jgi:hypothetical protein
VCNARSSHLLAAQTTRRPWRRKTWTLGVASPSPKRTGRWSAPRREREREREAEATLSTAVGVKRCSEVLVPSGRCDGHFSHPAATSPLYLMEATVH